MIASKKDVTIQSPVTLTTVASLMLVCLLVLKISMIRPENFCLVFSRWEPILLEPFGVLFAKLGQG